MAMNLTSNVSTSSSSVNHPIASKSPGTLKASTGKPDARAGKNSKPDAASSSQGRLKDAYFGGLIAEVVEKPAATDKKQESWRFSESESWSNHEKVVTGKNVASRNQKSQRVLKLEAGNGHIIFICLQQLYLTWLKSIRSYERFTAEVQRMA